jgi:hypothetical protein
MKNHVSNSSLKILDRDALVGLVDVMCLTLAAREAGKMRVDTFSIGSGKVS